MIEALYKDKRERIKDFKLSFPVRLRERMDALGIKNADLASALDVSVYTVNNMTCGKQIASSADLLAIAGILQCSADYLLDGKIDDAYICDEMVEVLREMTPDRQRRVARGLKEMFGI